jgi:ABC-type transport system involved in cytochrome c biogenesis ATPase subunit
LESIVTVIGHAEEPLLPRRAQPSPAIIEAIGLSKEYGHVVALADVELAVGSGEIYGLLGPNGAGKTTTLALLLGLLRPSVGRACIQGLDVVAQPVETKRRVGYLPEQVPLYGHLSGVENLEYFAALGGQALTRSELLVRLVDVGLSDGIAAARASTYSRGMRQRVGLAIALVRDPAARRRRSTQRPARGDANLRRAVEPNRSHRCRRYQSWFTSTTSSGSARPSRPLRVTETRGPVGGYRVARMRLRRAAQTLAIRYGFPLLGDWPPPGVAAVLVATPPRRKATGSGSGPIASADDPGTRG